MTTWTVLTTTWGPHPSVLVGCAALLAAYREGLRRTGIPVSPTRAAMFAGGVFVLGFSLVSPLDTLGDSFLFSAHMLQHLLLILAAPPLLLGGLPPPLVDRLLDYPVLHRLERVLGNPAITWSAGIGTLWIWHAPVLYDAALQYEGIHIAQHLSFLVTSAMLWWPVIVAPRSHWRLSVPLAILYLFAASMASSILGIILTFAPAGLYPLYLHPAVGISSQAALVLHVIRTDWGLDPASDQQLGGLLMWVPGGLVYLLAVCGILARWYGEPESDLPAVWPVPYA
ncbi:MAG TPA: cytochrome c oxidase assembly protein, partial [Chloroflexota bacterium]|nr:cytochrome c oxidase assembly protein [Chloroflexota bacterium]